MNLKDKTFTGKVSEWELPDGTVMDNKKYGSRYYINNGFLNAWTSTENFAVDEYKIKSLPDGYQFNDAGEIVKVEAKRYWKKGEKLEVGMWFINGLHGLEVKCIFTDQDDVVYRSGGVLWCAKESDAEEIDTRTDKEKAIDYIVSAGVNKTIAESILDRIIENKIDGLKWVGKDE